MSERTYEMTGYLGQDGKSLVFEHPAIMGRVLRYLAEDRLLIIVSKFRFKRSDAQNRYMHGVVVPKVQQWFADTAGEALSHDEVYVWLRVGLLGHDARVKKVKGVDVITMTGKRFSKMNTKEFAEAVDTITKLMDEKGCYIPLPKKDNLISDFADDYS